MCAIAVCRGHSSRSVLAYLPALTSYIYPALVDNQLTMRRVRSCCCRLSMSQGGKQVLRQPCSSPHRMTCTQADGEHALCHYCAAACHAQVAHAVEAQTQLHWCGEGSKAKRYLLLGCWRSIVCERFVDGISSLDLTRRHVSRYPHAELHFCPITPGAWSTDDMSAFCLDCPCFDCSAGRRSTQALWLLHTSYC
jgi:hypothetical protein